MQSDFIKLVYFVQTQHKTFNILCSANGEMCKTHIDKITHWTETNYCKRSLRPKYIYGSYV